MPGRLAHKHALVTGAARGIGEAIARAFVDEGARVTLVDLLVDEGEEVRRGLGEQATFRPLDVTSPNAWSDLVAGSAGDPFDVLVNNAGGLRHPAALHELQVDEWEDDLGRNLTSVFLGMRAVLPSMLGRGRGSIVNMSSISGVVGQADAPAYQAAKAGVRLLTKNAAITYARDGIRVNAICPGAIATHAVSLEDPERIRPFIERTPLGRQGLPHDVASAAVYLASDEAAFVTGTELFVDGGFTAQ
jgi:3alpha(or 20beta)-hydroxysteroid dehydrogenase